ncbi:MAG: hypothetical protein WC849_02095 [Candidatus Paceibacterota bacterium]
MFNKIISQSKKFLVFVLIVSMVAPSLFLYKPQKAEAIFGIGSDEAQIALWVKDYILDPLAYAFINALTAEMTREAKNWITGNNYTGPGGGKTGGFVTNSQSFFEKVGDRALGEFIQQKVPSFCSPFQVSIQGYLRTKYKSNAYSDRNYCTFTETKENMERAYNNFTQNFNNGGWERWVNVTVNPINNPYGAIVSADASAKAYIGGIKLLDEKELDWGKGFISWKKTEGECTQFAVASLTNKDGNPFLGGFGHWINPITKEDTGVLVTGNPPPCVGMDTRKTKIETPGSFLETGLSDAIGLSGDRLALGDEIDEIIGTLIARLVGIGFNAVGLGGKGSTSGEEDSINNTKRRISDMIDGMTSKTQEYVGIKKASLELIGKFALTSVQLGPSRQINQKINWAGNDFEWTAGIYYNEDRSTKIDWTGEPFTWRDDIHYREKDSATGLIKEVKCETLEDSLLPASYVTAESTTTPFWKNSTCLNIKEGETHIRYEWGPAISMTPTEKENSVAKAVSGFCDRRSVGTKGYTVVTESDNFWSSSSCEKIGTTSFDWAGIIKTEKKIYRDRTTRFIERKIDWDGVLFEWKEQATYDGRDIYFEPNEMGNTGDGEKSGFALNNTNDKNGYLSDFGWPTPKIKFLATPVKICFPAERESNSERKKVFGVIEGQNSGFEKWTTLECTKHPKDTASKGVLKWFVDQPGDQEDFGAWVKLGDTPPAKIRIPLEGDIFNNLDKNYGSVPIAKTFDDLSKCYGVGSEGAGKINSQIEERKKQRLQIISDILIAEKMIEDIKLWKNSFEDFGSGSSGYTYFLDQLNKTSEMVGISDEQISQANDEKRKIESENSIVKTRLRICEGGGSYVGTEEDYEIGYGETGQLGYDAGYSDAFGGNDNSGSLPIGDRLPNGEPTKKGYENGKKDGYYFGYIHGYTVGKDDINSRG